MRVQVPVLGTVEGFRTLKDIASGTPPKPPVDAPAVTVKDMSEYAAAALNAAATPSAARTEVVAAALPAAAGRTPKTAAPAPAVDKEAEAAKLLEFAENYLRANMKAMAIGKLEAIVKKYPGTEAAEKAQLKLKSLGA